MAKPREEGAGWSMRRRCMGQDLYMSGFETSAAAKKAMGLRVTALEASGKPKGLGPVQDDVRTGASGLRHGAAQVHERRAAGSQPNEHVPAGRRILDPDGDPLGGRSRLNQAATMSPSPMQCAPPTARARVSTSWSR